MAVLAGEVLSTDDGHTSMKCTAVPLRLADGEESEESPSPKGKLTLQAGGSFEAKMSLEELLSRVAMSAGTVWNAASDADERARADEHDEEAAHVGPEGEFELHLSGKYSSDMTLDELALLPAFLVKAGTACPGCSKKGTGIMEPESSTGRKAADDGAEYSGRQEL